MENETNLTPLRMIRIAKDLTREEMAEHFLVSSAYIGAIENNQRQMSRGTLKYGLMSLDITLEEYKSLEEFKEELLSKDLNECDKYKFMLIKTLGIVDKEEQEKTEDLLEKCYYKKSRVK